jgi:hypothetical protein
VDEAEKHTGRRATLDALLASSESYQGASFDFEPSVALVDLVSYPHTVGFGVAFAASHTPFAVAFVVAFAVAFAVASAVAFAVASAVAFVVAFAVADIRREESPGTHWDLTADSYFDGKPDTCSSDVL